MPAIVENRDDIVLQDVIQSPALRLVLKDMIVVFFAVAYGPPDLPLVSFLPPTVEDAEVQGSVGCRLHPARATGLQRPAGRVEPYVDTLDHVARYMKIIILQENHMAPEGLPAGGLNNLFDQLLTGPILGVGLALNVLVIVANGGWMPVSPQVITDLFSVSPDAAALGMRVGWSKDILLLPAETRLWWLSDCFLLPTWFPQRAAFSPGDILIAMGVFWALWVRGGRANDARDYANDERRSRVKPSQTA